jgi:carbonic anhydrase
LCEYDHEGLPFLNEILTGLPRITGRGTNTTIGKIDISPIYNVIATASNYAYDGSLTQPPCTEGVSWVIPQVTFPITVKQFNALKAILKFNSRYTQNILGDGNLLQIAKGNDSHPGETQQLEANSTA